jgi:hypothetical protein
MTDKKDTSLKEYIARYRQSDGTPQSLMEHLEGASVLASAFAGKIGLPLFGELMGLLHDLGKYSKAFQSYIKSSEGRIEPDEDEYVDARLRVEPFSSGSCTARAKAPATSSTAAFLYWGGEHQEGRSYLCF